MLTLLGKELRILRISRGEILKEMAEKLGITSAYLSAIENGKREPTQKFMNSLFSAYELSTEEKVKLEGAYQETIDSVSIDISSLTPEKRNLSLVFARQFNSLSDKEVKNIMEILNRKEPVQ